MMYDHYYSINDHFDRNCRDKNTENGTEKGIFEFNSVIRQTFVYQICSNKCGFLLTSIYVEFIVEHTN